jgi:NhaB family Na+:H+ antiporter
MLHAFTRNFLGHAPNWYKCAVIGGLIANPILLAAFGPVVAGWCVVAEFIATLAMALKCYPLQPGGLLAIETIVIGLTDAKSVYHEVDGALPIILLLVFMVAGIYFLKDLLLFSFNKLLVNVRSQTALALVFCATSALLSAFLDALTVIAVVMTVGMGFYQVYHKVASGKQHHDLEHDFAVDTYVGAAHHNDLVEFRAFLRGLLMHAAVGTALGGVTTQVGEPQNLLIAVQADWKFGEFFLHMAPATMPVLIVGLLTCLLVDKARWFGYGTPLPLSVRNVLIDFHVAELAKYSARERAILWVQGAVAILLVLALAFHVAEVGLIGLAIIVIATTFNGVTDEQRLGKAFEAALPFTALLIVFFVIVAAIHDQHLFEPVIEQVLALEGRLQIAMLYLANGVLSAVSDNVFVATIYIREVKAALLQGLISRHEFEQLAVAVNVGTNIPSVATPNGQAAFLFLLTSALAPLIRLSYGRMLWMALPYTITLSVTGLLAVVYLV